MISSGRSCELDTHGELASVHLTLRVKLCGRGPGAEADAARRLPHVSRRAAGGVPPPALVS